MILKTILLSLKYPYHEDLNEFVSWSRHQCQVHLVRKVRALTNNSPLAGANRGIKRANYCEIGTNKNYVLRSIYKADIPRTNIRTPNLITLIESCIYNPVNFSKRYLYYMQVSEGMPIKRSIFNNSCLHLPKFVCNNPPTNRIS